MIVKARFIKNVIAWELVFIFAAILAAIVLGLF